MFERVVEITAVFISMGVSNDKAVEVASQVARDEAYQEENRIREARYEAETVAQGETNAI